MARKGEVFYRNIASPTDSTDVAVKRISILHTAGIKNGMENYDDDDSIDLSVHLQFLAF